MKSVALLVSRFTIVVLVAGVAVSAATAGRAPTDPRLQANAADVKTARTLLLTKAKAGGDFTVLKGSSSDKEPDCAASAEPDLHLLTETADLDGPQLTSESLGAFVSSGASVFVSSAQATKAFRAFKASAVGKCLLKTVEAEGLQSGKVVPVRVSVGKLELFEWDVSGLRPSQGTSVPFEMVFAFYRYSRAVTALIFAGVPTAQVSDWLKQTSAQMVIGLMRAKL